VHIKPGHESSEQRRWAGAKRQTLRRSRSRVGWDGAARNARARGAGRPDPPAGLTQLGRRRARVGAVTVGNWSRSR
jgi:hypothetical protein